MRIESVGRVELAYSQGEDLTSWVSTTVLGAPGEARQDTYDGLEPSMQEAAGNAVEEFMRELEIWSMTLQRHCPKDWNRCSAILLHSFSGEVLTRDRHSPGGDSHFHV